MVGGKVHDNRLGQRRKIAVVARSEESVEVRVEHCQCDHHRREQCRQTTVARRAALEGKVEELGCHRERAPSDHRRGVGRHQPIARIENAARHDWGIDQIVVRVPQRLGIHQSRLDWRGRAYRVRHHVAYAIERPGKTRGQQMVRAQSGQHRAQLIGGERRTRLRQRFTPLCDNPVNHRRSVLIDRKQWVGSNTIRGRDVSD